MKGFGGKGLGRVGSSVIAGGTAAVVIATLGITGSQAAWTDSEYDTATFGALDCTDNSQFASTAWGKFLAAFVAGTDIAPLLDFDGLTVDSGSPTSTASLDSAEYLGDQAWASPLSLSALSTLELQAGVSLFGSPDVGVYTQYGQAFQSGQSTGASGLLTTAEGAVTLGSGDPEPPGVGSVDLASVLDEVIGGVTAIDPSYLTDLGIDLGAVASLTSLDACSAVWDGADLTDIDEMAPYLERDYLIADLGLNFGSALVADLVDDITELVGVLEEDLDELIDQDGLTGDLLTSVTGLVNGILDDLDDALGILSPFDGGLLDSATIDVDFDLSPVLDLLDDAYSSDDGTVTIDLGDATISADIDAIVGGINNLPPNSSLLTPAVLSAISVGVGEALANFVEDHLTPALVDLLLNATVTVELASSIGIYVLAVVDEQVTLSTTITGSIGSFLGLGGTPVVDTEITADGTLLTLLNTLIPGIVTDVLDPVVSGLTGGVDDALDTLLPAIGETLLEPLVADGGVADTLIDALLLEVTGTLVPGLLTALTPVFDLIGDLVQLSVNVQPDQGGDVPFPPPPTNDGEPGQWFESALRLALLDLGEDPLLAVYLGSSSAGLNAPLP